MGSFLSFQLLPSGNTVGHGERGVDNEPGENEEGFEHAARPRFVSMSFVVMVVIAGSLFSSRSEVVEGAGRLGVGVREVKKGRGFRRGVVEISNILLRVGGGGEEGTETGGGGG